MRLTVRNGSRRGLVLSSLCALLLIASVVANAERPRRSAAAPAATRSPAATVQPSPSQRAIVPASAGSSSQAMPTKAPAGWTLAFSDDFSGSSLSSRWFPYDGKPSGDPGGYFSSSHVRVANGQLHLKGYRDPSFGDRWVTAGIQNVRSLKQSYGRYLVRFRMQDGQGVSYALLLWPASNSWPPEIDFAEDNGASPRTAMLATLHYADRAGAHHSIRRWDHDVDPTHWHTLGVTWLPGHVKYTLDGATWGEVDSSAVPSVPMDLAMQTQTWDCGHTWVTCPDKTTPPEVDMTVDWVVAYRRA